MLSRASAAQLRAAAEAAQLYLKAGILFVPMPVLDQADYIQLVDQVDERLAKLEKEADE